MRLGLSPVETSGEVEDPVARDIDLKLVSIAAPAPKLLDFVISIASNSGRCCCPTAEAVA